MSKIAGEILNSEKEGFSFSESPDFLEILINTIPNPVFIKDSAGIFQGCNELFARVIIGLPKERIIGRSVFDLPDTIPNNLAVIYTKQERELFDSHGEQVSEEEFICADGQYRVFSVQKALYSGNSGEVRGIIGIMTDVTEIKKHEKTRSENEQKFYGIFEKSNDAIIIMDSEGRIVEWNSAAESILQLKREQTVNRFIWEINYLIATEDRKNQEYYNLNKELFTEFFRNRQANWVNKPDDRVVQLSDGSIRTIRTVVFPIGSDDGFMAGIIIRDITEKEQTKKLLQRTSGELNELETIINKSPAIAILWVNQPGWPVEYVSNNIRQFGYEPEEFYSGRLLYSDIVHPEDNGRFFSEIENYSYDDRIEFFQGYRIVTKFDSVRFVDVHTWIRRDKNGDITHYQGIIIDVTERRTAECELERLNRLLRLMSTCNLELIRSTDKTDLMMRICQIMVEIGGFDSIWIGLTDERENLVPFAQWGIDNMMLLKLGLKPTDNDYRLSPAGRALVSGSTVIVQDLDKNPDDFRWKSSAMAKGVHSVAAIPFYLGSASVGVMVINALEVNAFRQEEANFLNDLAENITYGVSYIDIFYNMKNMEQQLRISDKKFRSVVQELIDGITISDEDGKIIVWNNAMEKILGLTEKEMINKSIWDFQYEISPNEIKTEDNFNKIKSKTIDYLKHGIPNTKTYYERKYQCQGGEQKTIEGSLFSVKTVNGFMLVNIIRDITNSKKAEEEIKKLNSELEVRVIERTMQLEEALRDLKMEVNVRQRMTDDLRKAKDETSKALIKEKELVELKNRFISMISHEYRTPLTIILSSTNLVERFNNRKQPEKSQKYISKIKKSVRDLTFLLEDVLMIGKSDAGMNKANIQPMDLEALCRESIDDVITMYDFKYDIQLEIDGNFNVVKTDVIVLKNIIINLLTNAVKFSGDSPVVKLKLSESDSNYVISVIDKGIGISEDDKCVLFDLFIRGSNAVSIPGTGLGLSIVKRSIDLLGGRVEVESSLGTGSTFVIYLPKL